jgi:hypothetical protein
MANCDERVSRDNGNPTEHAFGSKHGKRRLIDDRSYLTAAGRSRTWTAAAAPTAATATASAATTRGGIDFDRTVDAVDDLGCDPTGARACQDRIAAAASDGTLVEVPSGTYRVDGDLAVRGAQNVGIVGDGDVTFEVPADSQVQLGFEDVTEGLFAGVTVDQRAPGAVARTRFGCAGGTRARPSGDGDPGQLRPRDRRRPRRRRARGLCGRDRQRHRHRRHGGAAGGPGLQRRHGRRLVRRRLFARRGCAGRHRGAGEVTTDGNEL